MGTSASQVVTPTWSCLNHFHTPEVCYGVLIGEAPPLPTSHFLGANSLLVSGRAIRWVSKAAVLQRANLLFQVPRSASLVRCCYFRAPTGVLGGVSMTFNQGETWETWETMAFCCNHTHWVHPPPTQDAIVIFLNLHFVTGWVLHRSNMHNQMKSHQEKCSDDVCFFLEFWNDIEMLPCVFLFYMRWGLPKPCSSGKAIVTSIQIYLELWTAN